MLAVAGLTVAAVCAAPAAAATFDGVQVEARVISVDTAKESATVRIGPSPAGSFAARPNLNVLTKDVVLYTNTVDGSLAHNYRSGDLMDPFETTVPLEGDTSNYPFHHLRIEIDTLATTGGGVRSGDLVRVRIRTSSNLSGYRITPHSVVREGTNLQIFLRVDPSWAAVLFAVFIMAVMWALALAAIAVVVSLVARRRRFEGAFTALLAALLFAFPTVRNALPGIPPVGVLFDYAAFFWAEAIVALALVALIAGWTTRALVGTGERRD
jgi:hypothetical protein